MLCQIRQDMNADQRKWWAQQDLNLRPIDYEFAA